MLLLTSVIRSLIMVIAKCKVWIENSFICMIVFFHFDARPCNVISVMTLITRFMGPTWGPSGADRTQVGPMLAPWTLLSGKAYLPGGRHHDNYPAQFTSTHLTIWVDIILVSLVMPTRRHAQIMKLVLWCNIQDMLCETKELFVVVMQHAR